MENNKVFQSALKNHQNNNFEEAEKLYLQILKKKPDHADTNYLIGTLYAQIKKYKLAIKFLNFSLNNNYNNPNAYYNLANIYQSLNNFNEALINYKKTLNIDDKYLKAYLNIGHIYFLQKHTSKSIKTYNKILTIDPNYINAMKNLGIVFLDSKNFDEAKKLFIKCIEIDSLDSKTYFNLGSSYLGLANYQKSIFNFIKAIELQSKYPSAYNSLGYAYKKINKIYKAKECYEKSIEQDPLYVQAKLNYGNILDILCETEKSIKIYKEAIIQKPDKLSLRWACLNTFPVIYKDSNEIKFYNQHFANEITNIEKYINTIKKINKVEILDALLNSTNFYLHYQGINNLDLQKRYASCIEKLTYKIYPNIKSNFKKTKNRKIRIGFVSPCFIEHSISNTHKNFYLKLNKNIFETYIYHIENETDRFTTYVKKNVHSFFQNNNLDLIVKNIEKDILDIIIFIDIGMHVNMQILSSLRFAPIQINGNGQPVTSGFKNIDYVISSDLMEPLNANEHYTEKLIRLSGTGQCYEEPNIKLRNTQTNKIPIFFNLQNLFKLLPDEDQIYINIIKKIKNCEIWFMEARNPLVTENFKKRLSNIFIKNNIDLDKYIKFKRRRSQIEFFDLINKSDIVLDSFNWSGNNTSHQALSIIKPIVTMPGKFMRSRHTYALLRKVKVDETIAKDKKNYIEIIYQIVNDINFKKTIIDKIKKNKHLLFNDIEPIKELEIILQSFVK